MTANDESPPTSGAPKPNQAPDQATDQPSDQATDHLYFHAIEEAFIRLRGAPLLLSPADWHVARRWNREGIPFEVVEAALEEIFRKRRERGVETKVSSLRYCAPAVEKAWGRRAELMAAGFRGEAAEIDVGARVRALARALPEELPGREEWAGRVTGIGRSEGAGGDVQAVEDGLARIDREILDRAREELGAENRRELDQAVAASLERLAGRLSDREIEQAATQLRRRHLRRLVGLPLLSIFSPEARVDSG